MRGTSKGVLAITSKAPCLSPINWNKN